mgnify:CR=1 FL=1
MADAGFLNYNGKICRADKLLISPNNRSFRYGDGCFETIKMIRGKMILEEYHFERLFASIEHLQFEKPNFFNPQYLKEQVVEIAKKNYHDKLARIRLMVFRGNGGLYDPENHFPNFLIQTWELNPANNALNENGLVIDVLIFFMILRVAFLSRIIPLHHPHDITLGDGQPILSSIPKNEGYFCSISIAVLMSVSGFQP